MRNKYYFSTVTKRALAFFIDLIVLSPLYYFDFVIVFKNFSEGNFSLFPRIILSIITPAYFILLTYFFGKTIGKLILGIKVVSSNSSGLSFWQVVRRELIGKMLSGAFFNLGYFAAISDNYKQAWHDKLAQTYVLSNSPEPKKEPKIIYLFIALYLIIPFIVFILVVRFVFIPFGDSQAEISHQQDDKIRIETLKRMQELIKTTQEIKPPRTLCEGIPPCYGRSNFDSRVQNIDGTGWIKVDFRDIEGVQVKTLPLDPKNGDYSYYYYCSNGKDWKLYTPLKSKLYKEEAKNDGGFNPDGYEIGSDLSACQ